MKLFHVKQVDADGSWAIQALCVADDEEDADKKYREHESVEDDDTLTFEEVTTIQELLPLLVNDDVAYERGPIFIIKEGG